MKRIFLKQDCYIWHGTNEQGMRKSGEIIAFSLNLAKLNLLRKGIQLSSIHKKTASLLCFEKAISPLDITLFFRQLATLVSSGIPISHAIHLLSQNTEHKKLLGLINLIKENIATGKGLTQSLRKFPTYFDEMTCSLIQAGEKAGKLEVILERIAQQKEKTIALKNKIKQALFYPVMITSTAILVSIVMLTCIVPRFAELFQNMHSTLPAFTRGVIAAANLLSHHAGALVFLLSSSALCVIYCQKFPRVKIASDWLLLNLPGMGASLRKIILARFARNLGTIFSAGIPITDALTMIENTMGNSFYSQAVKQMSLDIATGKQLHAAMSTDTLFPPMMLQMTQVGEESGTLETMLMKIADFYEDDIDRLIANLSKLLEPLIMMILGVLIGGLVIAMYLPIFKLGTVI